MNFLKQHMTAFIIVALVIVGFVLYGMFMVEDEPRGVTEEVVLDPGNELITILQQLKALRLNGAVFENPTFQGLVDFSLDLAPEDVGRANPFAPL